MSLPRPWDDHRLPRSAALTVYRPIPAHHPALPYGQLARDRAGRWYYRPAPPTSDQDEHRPAFLRPDLDHLLWRRGQLSTASDAAKDDLVRRRTLDAAFKILGTAELREIEDALEEACDAWHLHAPDDRRPGGWVTAPPALAALAEDIRPAGTRW